MFDTWASYESTRAFVTSSFLWQRRGSDFQTATLAAWQPSNRLHITLRHLRAATIQSSRRHERPSISTGRTTPPSLAILSTRPIRVRPTQSEHRSYATTIRSVYLPGAFGAPGTFGAPGGTGAPGAFGAPGTAGAPGVDAAAAALKSAPQFVHFVTPGSFIVPQSGHLTGREIAEGLKHM